jgi:predicted outer membrane repeat protein
LPAAPVGAAPPEKSLPVDDVCGTVEPANVAGTHNFALWPGGIVPIEFHDEVLAENVVAFNAALFELEAVCGVQFIERTDETNYIIVENSTNPGVSSSSHIGRAPLNIAQYIRMASWGQRIVWHEMMHALGFYHEQSRTDRDDYVQINWLNINPSYIGNFNEAGASTANGPYDFASVMHYRNSSFTTNGQWTITVLHPYQDIWQNLIGQLQDLSNGDVWTLTELYGGDPPPRAVRLIAPADNAIVPESATTTFTWTPGVEGVSYRVLVDDDPDFGSPLIDEVVVGSDSYVHSGALPSNTIQYWTVEASNAHGTAKAFPFPRFRLYRGGPVAGALYVDDDAAPGGSGADWSAPVDDLQKALDLARVNGGVTEIHVAQGTYRPDRGTGSRLQSFELVDGVPLRGGYAGVYADDPGERDIEAYETILTGDLAGDDNVAGAGGNVENSYHVLSSTSFGAEITVEGFTIIGGNADGGVWERHGGGLLLLDCDPGVIRDCDLRGHSCAQWGGAMAAIGPTASYAVEHCSFESNDAGNVGGALYASLATELVVSDGTFVGNASTYGGAIFTDNWALIEVYDSSFVGNTSVETGGAIYADDSGDGVLDGCVFLDNAGLRVGGAAMNVNTLAVNCLFSGNMAEIAIGGLRVGPGDGTVVNCSFAGNSAGNNSGAIRVVGGSATTLVNSVVWGNTAAFGPQLGLGTVFGTGAVLTVEHSAVESGAAVVYIVDDTSLVWGEGNLEKDPMLADAANHDLHLLSGSVAIDAGDNAAVPLDVTTDLDGNARIIGGTVDMGAYELCPADTDGNGAVDADDLVNLILDWGTDGSQHGGDVDGSGVVDADDLVTLILSWGPCT